LQLRSFLNLGSSARLFGFRNVNQIFIKRNARLLIKRLRQAHGQNVIDTLIRYSRSDQFTKYWTEFALYGVFSRCVLKGGGHFYEKRKDVAHFLKYDNCQVISDRAAVFENDRAGDYD